MRLLLGTTNAGKIREITEFLKNLPLEFATLKEYPKIPAPEESGKSFIANARAKALYYQRQTGLVTLAEDSGLQVDFLGGEPGCFSARFAGQSASDRDNVRKLLALMRGVKSEARTARFVCVAVLADGKKTRAVTGTCEGRIATRPIGSSGFGYDPVFIPLGYRTTFARLGEAEKNRISHRAEAFRQVRQILETMTACSQP